MWFELMLASQFCLMSDRAFFWDTEKISNQTTYIREGNTKSNTFEPKELEGKNVLLLVHGYNNDFVEALSTYQLINAHVSAFEDAQNVKFYDLVIGYFWPGDDSGIEYYDAKNRVSALANKMKSHLDLLSASAAKVDVLAHSMGNFLMFEALNYQISGGKKLIQNFYALAPAIDDESLEMQEKYYLSTQNCERVFVFYSNRDDVLKWFYRLAEKDKALGYGGTENPDKLPCNVELVNYSNYIDGHSQYFTFLPFYEFIKQQFLLKK